MDGMLQVLAQSDGQGGGMLGTLIWLAVMGAFIASFWKVFTKAGQPGWAAIVPFVNCYYLCKIAGRPAWWMLLMLVPLVNIAVFAVLSIDVAKAFGKSAGFGVGLWLLGFIFYPILAFGAAEYQGPQTGSAQPVPGGERAMAA